MGQEIRDRFSGAVEAFARRNGSGHALHGDHSRHRSSDDVPSSKDVVSTEEKIIHFCMLYFMPLYFSVFFPTLYLGVHCFHWIYLIRLFFVSLLSPLPPSQHPDSERLHSSSRNGSTSKRAVISSSRPSSSGEPSENRSSRLLSSSGRLSTTQRIQPGFESKSSSFTRATATRGGRDDALRSFELLSIGTGKRK